MSTERNQPAEPISSIAIVGGGTAGWMAAAALAKVIGTAHCKITLVESEDIGTVGVGEATIPPIASFNDLLGIDANDMLRATEGTCKLGVEFLNWGQIGDRYMHPFGNFGPSINNIAFYHYWKRAYELGLSPGLGAYSINTLAAGANKFAPVVKRADSPPARVVHAYHFDAALYARYLARFSMALGLERVEGVVERVIQNKDTGFIESLCISGGRNIAADFFIDCTGFRGLLIEQTLKTGFDDWGHYLPCNSALAVPTAATTPLLPYTKLTAHGFGWQWRIPLQHRTGNGLVYSNTFIDDADAADLLLANLDADTLAEPRQLRFSTGRRKQTWNKNCIAVGLSSGFLEPLESTSIHQIQSTISRFLGLFPRKNSFQAEMERFNKLSEQESIGIRDFLILHYKATARTDTEFWNHCRTMAIPDSLQAKLDLYQSSSGLYRDDNELFSETSWLAVLHGQGASSHDYHPIADAMPVDELEKRLHDMRERVQEAVQAMPSHDAYIESACKSVGH